jgi:hypothetical protein
MKLKFITKLLNKTYGKKNQEPKIENITHPQTLTLFLSAS